MASVVKSLPLTESMKQYVFQPADLVRNCPLIIPLIPLTLSEVEGSEYRTSTGLSPNGVRSIRILGSYFWTTPKSSSAVASLVRQ